MRVLLRAVFHLSSLRGSDPARVAIVVDSDTGISAGSIAALLHPWRSWLEIVDILVTNADPGDGWVDLAAASGAQAVSIVSERPEFARVLEDAINQRGLRVLGSDYSTDSERSAAFFHEMAHHHFELGGLNEWDGSTVLYAPHVLQHISATNCITHFPQYMIEELRARRA